MCDELKNTHSLDIEDFGGNRHRLVNTAKLYVSFGKGETLAHKRDITVSQENRETQLRGEEGTTPSPSYGSEPTQNGDYQHHPP